MHMRNMVSINQFPISSQSKIGQNEFNVYELNTTMYYKITTTYFGNFAN